MKKNRCIYSFLAGMLVALFIVSLIPSAMALAGKTIQVYTGINIYVNDQKIEPKDANGNPVEAFVYNGTTYLPIRAIGNALGISVAYDGATTSAYVGKHASDKPAVMLKDLNYFSGTTNRDFSTAVSEQDNTGATHYNCITDDFDRIYLLNGQYTRLSGILYQAYENRSLIAAGDNRNFLQIYGDDELLYSTSFKKGQTGIDPVPFSVDLTGVLRLRVRFGSNGGVYGYENSMYKFLSLGDVGLYT